jgi:pimeloyl-ACP methyl ester carboxylesterase
VKRSADWQVHELTASDGTRIAVHRVGDAQAVPVLLVSGTFSNHTFWFGTRGVGFARELAWHGYEAVALDPRGHGDSQRPADGDRWDFDDWAREDVPTALRMLVEENRRPFIVGHSAGGAAVLSGLAAEPALRGHVRGLVIAATPVPWLQPWRGVGARLIRASSRLLTRFPARVLRLGPEDELPGVMIQWMTWNIDGHWRGDDGTDYEAGMRGLGLPLLTLAGTGDRFFAPPRACQALHDLIGSPDKTFRLCGRSTGCSVDFDHVSLLVGRAARTEVWPLILNWLAEHGDPAAQRPGEAHSKGGARPPTAGG